MRRINGITLIFILGIMSVLFGISMMNKVYEKHQAKNTDNGSTFVRYGETFEDQMTFKAPIEVNNIPLTIVTAPPEIPREAHITFGEQNVRDLAKYPDYKISQYKRDIFIYYPADMKVKRFSFIGFQPTIKPKKKRPNPELADELQHLGFTAEHDMSITINDGRKLPTKTWAILRNNLLPPYGDEFALDLTIKDEFVKFNSKEKIKFTIEVEFRCKPTMIKRKAIYKLMLEDILMFYPIPANDAKNPPHDLPAPIKDFFVIKCGE